MTKEGLLVFLLMIGIGVGIAARYDSSMPKPYHANSQFLNQVPTPPSVPYQVPSSKPVKVKAKKPEIKKRATYSGSGQKSNGCHDPEGWDRGNCNPNFVTPGIRYY